MSYTKDLRDKEWKAIKKLFPSSKRGRPREHSFRNILNAIFYVDNNGIKWRDLPVGFPPWKTVHHYFLIWSKNSLLEKIQKYLTEKVRKKSRRNKEPSLLAIDSSSIKCSKEAKERGIDGYKKIKGHRMHSLVDTMGLIHELEVTKANEGDKTVAMKMFEKMGDYRGSLKKVVADQGYRGKDLEDLVRERTGAELVITKKLGDGFIPAPFRWIVERTFAWLSFSRRLSKNYERNISSFKSWIRLSMIRLLLSKLYYL